MKHHNIRNFCIIAHIDHGKTTLSDCFLKKSTLYDAKMHSNDNLVLDSLALEKERGVTIKANYSLITYEYQGEMYHLNLIDTPGHADFNYEVMRSLAVCDGAILLVDASKGVQAQTISNYRLAQKFNLPIIPVLNKVDLSLSNPEEVKLSLSELFGFDYNDILCVSAKNNTNIDVLLQEVIKKFPAPNVKTLDDNKNFKGFIYDSYFDAFRGTVAIFKVVSGFLNKNVACRTLNTKTKFKVLKLGHKIPNYKTCEQLTPGEIGFIETGIKDFKINLVGDTFVNEKSHDNEPYYEYQKLFPMVYACFFPLQQSHYKLFQKSFDKLALNDNSLTYVPCFSHALGFGMRCGFLGSLHLEITQQRLETEFNLNLISTLPSVVIKAKTTKNEIVNIYQPQQLKTLGGSKILQLSEPYVEIIVIVHTEFLGPVMQHCINCRGTLISNSVIDKLSSQLVFEIPLIEIISDFADHLKTLSKGYCSYTYEMLDYRPNKLGLLEILLNNKPADYFALVVHKDNAYRMGSELCHRLKNLLPQQNFEISIQAAFNNRIIARSSVKALRKNVAGKCYGGDITRKNKLLDRQKEGKKKMKMLGNVAIPKDVFTKILTRK